MRLVTNCAAMALTSRGQVAENMSVWRCAGMRAHNLPDLRLEAHVQHAVRLVQHQVGHLRHKRSRIRVIDTHAALPTAAAHATARNSAHVL